MIQITTPEHEFDRAFTETLLKIEKYFREQAELGTIKLIGNVDPFRSVNYYVHELKSRLEKG